MSTETELAAQQGATRALAETIYAGLVAESVEIDGSGVKMSASAENLAKLSIKLAQAFDRVEIASREEGKPDKNYALDAASIASWTK